MSPSRNEKRFTFAQQCIERWNHTEAMVSAKTTSPHVKSCLLEVFCCLVWVEYECYQRLGRTDDEVASVVDGDFKNNLKKLRDFWFHPQPDITNKLRRFHLETPDAFNRCVKLHKALRHVFVEEVEAAGGAVGYGDTEFLALIESASR